MTQAIEFLAQFGHSDFCGTMPSASDFIINQSGHMAIGALAYRIAPLLIALAWVAKEAALDIPNCAYDLTVLADSVIDLCFGAIGFRLMYLHKRKGMKHG